MPEKMKNEIYSWAKSIIIALVIVFICRNFLFSPETVKGESMVPTFQDNNRVIISKISQVKRFDLIVFNAPDSNSQYIKRVIGMPGDRIEMKNDRLYINGKSYNEPYVNRPNIPTEKVTEDFTLKELTGRATVPKGSLFVLGDNRLVSKDSRSFGYITENSVVGVVKFRYYPLQKISIPK